ncbi:MAG: hypothetical protein EOO20_02930 [Chryseobacterium sp.]|uniref:DUF6766 family protein n=1 Tax=Pedobacter agri TaxID=454586 RepID=UPI00120319A6|nr:DUF6766 family protein [Pedobacter agri]MDQ1142766.1 hypothetical protein [Pedobacter agri]RZJ92103.1 MAG: hypothetical protein EOO20_02930 [Chryseobacterium sp.]
MNQRTQHNQNKPWIYRNSLSIFFLSIFFITLSGQALTGWKELNSELAELNGKQVSLSHYLTSGHFISATFENFESEFLQMSLYVLITIGLRQIGSAESKKLEENEDVDREPRPSSDAPWPVKRGGWILWLYSNSLSIAFCILFLICWALHFYGSWENNNLELSLKGKPEENILHYLGGSKFWFETFQNWQSEFLSVASIVLLTIFLRQKGSPESKPVDSPDWKTGK